MFRKIILSSFLFSLIFSNSDLDKGKQLYTDRHENSNGVNASSQNIDKAITHLKIALQLKDTEVEAAVYLLKCYYYKGEFAVDDTETQKSIFNLGKSLGTDYIQKDPDNMEFRYWYLVNLGSWAKVYGILTAAKEGVADQMKEHAERIIDVDPKYENGGGYYMLGAVHYKSPYIPFLLSWPDNEEAVKYLTLANKTGTATLNQKNYLAQAIYKEGQVVEAKALLSQVINTVPDPKNLVEERNFIQEAREILEGF